MSDLDTDPGLGHSLCVETRDEKTVDRLFATVFSSPSPETDEWSHLQPSETKRRVTTHDTVLAHIGKLAYHLSYYIFPLVHLLPAEPEVGEKYRIDRADF